MRYASTRSTSTPTSTRCVALLTQVGSRVAGRLLWHRQQAATLHNNSSHSPPENRMHCDRLAMGERIMRWRTEWTRSTRLDSNTGSCRSNSSSRSNSCCRRSSCCMPHLMVACFLIKSNRLGTWFTAAHTTHSTAKRRGKGRSLDSTTNSDGLS